MEHNRRRRPFGGLLASATTTRRRRIWTVLVGIVVLNGVAWWLPTLVDFQPSADNNHNLPVNTTVPSSLVALQAQLQQQQQEGIPRLLLFTHKTNLLGPEAAPDDLRFFDNLVHLIQLYAEAWHDASNTVATNTTAPTPTTTVWFLDDADCERIIPLAEPQLLPFYQKEPRGALKGDICRGAALYLTGGYYFDVDMQAIAPVQFLNNNAATFSTVLTTIKSGDATCFNSFMAATPQHSILHNYLQGLLNYYVYRHTQDNNPVRESRSDRRRGTPSQRRKQSRINREWYQQREPVQAFCAQMPHAWFCETNNDDGTGVPRASGKVRDVFLGPDALKAAVQHHLKTNASSSLELFWEEDLQNETLQKQRHPNLTFQRGGAGCCCNFVVQNAARQPFFFSRMVGAGISCEYPDDEKESKLQQAAELAWSERQARLLPVQAHVKFFQL